MSWPSPCLSLATLLVVGDLVMLVVGDLVLPVAGDLVLLVVGDLVLLVVVDLDLLVVGDHPFCSGSGDLAWKFSARTVFLASDGTDVVDG